MDDINAEWRRLQQVYAGLGDAELQELMRERAELTDVARQALEAEAGSRGLKVADVAEVVATPLEDFERDSSDVPENDPWIARLWVFDSSGEAATATAALEEAGILCRTDAVRDPVLGSGQGVGLFVESRNVTAAVAVLRQRMGMFPEVEEQPAVEEDGLFVAGSYETEEAAEAGVALLRGKGIAGVVRPESDEEGSYWVVKVGIDDFEEATGLVGN